MQTKHPDSKIIEELGGPAKVAELIGAPKENGTQRVQNWTVRGIPSHIKVTFPHLFMPQLLMQATNAAQTA